MDKPERKQRIVELEGQYRRTETALAVAHAAHERSFAELWEYVNEAQGTQPVMSYPANLTMH